GGYKPGTAEVAFALEKRVGGHVFSLVVANTQATTYGQLARGATRGTDDKSPLYIGFNLARKFYGEKESLTMKRLSPIAVVLALLAAGSRNNNSTTPATPTNPTFTATLSPA